MNWRMDVAYVEVAGQWKYLYRTVNCDGETVDFFWYAMRDHAAALQLLER